MVSRSGYYKWCRAQTSAHDKADKKLSEQVKEIHTEHKGRYGSPRIHQELKSRGLKTSRKRVARVMKEQELRGYTRRRFRHTTDSRHKNPIAPNILERNFSADAPNQVWVGDITYIPTVEGWLYLGVLIDLFSRRVVGWAMSDHIDTELVVKVFRMALNARGSNPGLIHHTDRDCRYASKEYQLLLSQNEVIPSMSRKGDCWDNAVAESLFATIEKELLASLPINPRKATRTLVAEYIEGYYNLRRRHSHIDFFTPIQYELIAA